MTAYRQQKTAYIQGHKIQGLTTSLLIIFQLYLLTKDLSTRFHDQNQNKWNHITKLVSSTVNYKFMGDHQTSWDFYGLKDW